MKKFEKRFPKPDAIQAYHYPNELRDWESKKEGWKEALKWVLYLEFIHAMDKKFLLKKIEQELGEEK